MTDGKPTISDLRLRHDEKQPRRPRRWLLAAFAALVVLAALAIRLAVGTGRPPVVEVAAAAPAASDRVATVLNASGYVTPRRRATVSAKITGKVSEVLVDEGMPVEEGQVLARLDDSDARRRAEALRADREVALAALDEIEVDLADAERTLRRTLDLAGRGVASQQDLDSATAAVDGMRARLAVARRTLDAAEAQLAVAAQDLTNYVIRAPFAGIAVSKDAQPGEMVSPVSAGGGFTRTGISTIVDMASLEIEVDVSESSIARVSVGQPADAVLDAYPDWHIPARVRTVIPTADRQKATVKVRLTFDQLDPRILPDMGVKVAFHQPAAQQGQLPAAQSLVPSSAVRRDGDDEFVFVLEGDRVERRAVAVGRRFGSEVEIAAGVTAGERVVLGEPDLADGQRVRTAG